MMWKIIFLIISYFYFVQSIEENEDAILLMPELVKKYGYPCEEYKVTTSDNYILTIHRIPHGRTHNRKNKVVFLQHGILSSSADWIISGVGRGLGYLLADEGYDVWMGNARGNKYSRHHVYWNPNKTNEFWDFSWHEIGYYDLPTMIDFVLEKTNQKDLFYIGHSQGTTSFYVMASTRPEYNRKIKAQFSLAPIAFMNHMTSPLFHIIAFWEGPLEMLLDLIGVREFLPSNKFMAMAGNVICGNHRLSKVLCENSLFAICGFSTKEMNATLLPILMGHTPAGSSTKQFMHYAQEIDSGHFRMFDYGEFAGGNLQKYGRIFPPKYNLRKVTAPVFLFWSFNDWLSAKEDVFRLDRQLGNSQGKILVGDYGFNHLDYMFGINAKELVYNKVISLMATFRK